MEQLTRTDAASRERVVQSAAGLQERPCSGRELPCLGRGVQSRKGPPSVVPPGARPCTRRFTRHNFLTPLQRSSEAGCHPHFVKEETEPGGDMRGLSKVTQQRRGWKPGAGPGESLCSLPRAKGPPLAFGEVPSSAHVTQAWPLTVPTPGGWFRSGC